MLHVGGPVPTLVAADIHLGLGESLPGVLPADATADKLAERILEGLREIGGGRILLVGDIKEPVRKVSPFVRREVLRFFQRLRDAQVPVEVVLGNHDAGLVHLLPPGVILHPSSGLLRDGIGYFHGHAWPSRRILLRARTLVVGHLHPGYRLAPASGRALGGKQPCWVHVDVDPPPHRSRRRVRHPRPQAQQIIVLPAFNPLCAGEALNREEPQRLRRFLVRRFLSLGEARAFLLDGTDLGPLHWQIARKAALSAPTPHGRPYPL
jgi:metallophosphoesterase superfamily enzyme